MALNCNLAQSNADRYEEYSLFGSFMSFKHSEGHLQNEYPAIKYDGSNTETYNFGLGYLLHLPEPFSIYLKLGYTSFDLKQTAVIDHNYVHNDIEYDDGRASLSFAMDLSHFSVQPGLKVAVFSGLELDMGVHFGFMPDWNWTINKELIEAGSFMPTQVTLPGTDNYKYSTEAANAKSQIFNAFFAGLEWDFYLNDNWSVTPFINASLPFAINAKDNFDWDLSYVRAGLSINLNNNRPINNTEISRIVVYRTDTITVGKQGIRNQVFAIGQETEQIACDTLETGIICTKTIFRTDSVLVPDKTASFVLYDQQLNVPVRNVYESIPLAPDIYFPANSAMPKGKQRFGGRNGFNIQAIARTPEMLQNNLLNIIGQRLLDNPDAKIIVRGYIDSSEKRDCRLARARADYVGNYLQHEWGIDSRRVSCSGHIGQCIAPASISGMPEDNMKAEIITLFPDILAALPIGDSEEAMPGPGPEILLSADKPEFPYGHIVFVVKSKDRAAGTVIDPANLRAVRLPANTSALDLNSSSAIVSMIVLDDSMTDTLARTSRKIDIQKQRSGKDIHRLTLLMDRQNGISAANRKKIDLFISEYAHERPLQITGYTSNIDPEQRLLRKSLNWTRTVADYIINAHDNDIVRIQAHGPSYCPSARLKGWTAMERRLANRVVIEVAR